MLHRKYKKYRIHENMFVYISTFWDDKGLIDVFSKIRRYHLMNIAISFLQFRLTCTAF